MAINYSEYMKKTPGNRPVPGKNQIQNHDGNFVFEVDVWTRLNRFLILGSEGGSYYASQQDLTLENIQSVLDAIKEDGTRVVDEVVAVSKSGRAPKNDPALFVLAAVTKFGDIDARRAAFQALPQVARIGTHLYHFVSFREGLNGGWGRGMKKAIRQWYQNKPLDKLALQAIKYKQRDGWSHRDLLRLVKPKPDSPARDSIYGFMVNGDAKEPVPSLIEGHELAKNASSESEIAEIITEYGLPREAVPTEFLNSVKVWRTMLPYMPINALVRNLGKMSSIGVTEDPEAVQFIVNKLTDSQSVSYSRVHPIQILTASKTYESGRGFKGKLSWRANRDILSALDKTFELAFGNVDPAGKNWVIGVDVSGSMGMQAPGSVNLTCTEVAAAMALTMAKTELNTLVFGFDHGFKPMHITENSSLSDAVKACRPYNFGGTDCSLPMTWAQSNKVEADVFMVLTDCETNFNAIHPHQALVAYREKMGIPAKLVVVSMVPNRFSIADPDDVGMLDVAGFDTSVPRLVTDFARGFQSLTVPRVN